MWTVCPERDRDSLQSVNSKIADRNVGKGKEIQFYWIKQRLLKASIQVIQFNNSKNWHRKQSFG